MSRCMRYISPPSEVPRVFPYSISVLSGFSYKQTKYDWYSKVSPMAKAPVSVVVVTSVSPCGKGTARKIHRSVSDTALKYKNENH